MSGDVLTCRQSGRTGEMDLASSGWRAGMLLNAQDNAPDGLYSPKLPGPSVGSAEAESSRSALFSKEKERRQLEQTNKKQCQMCLSALGQNDPGSCWSGVGGAGEGSLRTEELY